MSFHKFKNLFVLSSCVIGLAACSGTTTAPTASIDYQSFDAVSSENSVLEGLALTNNNKGGGTQLRNVTGSISHLNGAIVINDTVYDFRDTSGPDGSKNYVDASGAKVTLSSKFDSSKYDSVRIFDVEYPANGGTSTGTVLVGVATVDSDVRTSNTAVYNGDASGSVVTQTTGFNLTNGKSKVTADFGSGTVLVELDGFTSTSLATDKAAAAPIDRITITGAQIAGSTFTGGTVTTHLGNTLVNILGQDITVNSGGRFFGFDAATGNPDEVGGLLHTKGTGGTISGAYIAD